MLGEVDDRRAPFLCTGLILESDAGKSGRCAFLRNVLQTSENLARTLLFALLKHTRWERQKCALLNLS